MLGRQAGETNPDGNIESHGSECPDHTDRTLCTQNEEGWSDEGWNGSDTMQLEWLTGLRGYENQRPT